MKYRELFKVEELPVFQNKMFPDQMSALVCPKGDMTLVQDLDTGLVFNASFDAGLLEYDADYQNEQACSEVFQKHLEDVKEIIRRHFSGKSLIEVGCGKGYFLEYLHQAGYEITGIDPAYEGENPKVIKARFEASLGMSAEGIVLRHVLEHISNPLAFLFAIAQANGGKGQIYIEVPCLEWICEHRAWFDIFYEHVNYFRLADFHRMFGKVHEGGHVFGGQYLYVVAELATLQKPMFDPRDVFAFPTDFLADIAHVAAMAKGKRNAIWGGASKGVIFALYMQRAGVNVDLVIDINPAKQAKFMAGSGLKISSPKEGLKALQGGDNVFVMNSNYLQEIVALTNNQFNYIQVDRHEL
ncbi:methyltransferase [Sulfuricella sp. T08]|uniref:class I SAM-dependent methyltransferase n=1 Tax=Sulfuricella sp. T08 TaxID=1632857 RepID=UPI00061798DC|nr:class I SAM-dependent methyltransferase [Sulfuricella sp. T08]GAO34790.1 methyltransferase [Sulfuricella sp. T08]